MPVVEQRADGGTPDRSIISRRDMLQRRSKLARSDTMVAHSGQSDLPVWLTASREVTTGERSRKWRGPGKRISQERGRLAQQLRLLPGLGSQHAISPLHPMDSADAARALP
jgi:hypothetical protein